MDPLEEQMQRLSLGKRIPNIVHGKDGMKELISYMTVNTKPKQVIRRFTRISVLWLSFLVAFRHSLFSSLILIQESSLISL